MSDKRELILSRLHDVLKTIVPEGRCFRNQVDFPEGSPTILLLDADESPDSNRAPTSGRPPTGACVVALTPEIHILVDGKPKDVGPRLNALRRDIIKAVLTDNSLAEFCMSGELRYEGFASGFAAGRSFEGQGVVSFSFVYALHPARL